MSDDPKTSDDLKASMMDFDPGALAALEAKFSAKASTGGKPPKIPRRSTEVTIPVGVVTPGTFDSDLKIRVEALAAADELACLKAGGDASSGSLEMARKAMRELNGQPIRQHQRDLIWECLGMTGRGLVANAYLVKCSGVEATDLGKSLPKDLLGGQDQE